MSSTARTVELRRIAQRIADALPATVEEAVVTGSVSRGVADDVSDIEMLIVTEGELDLDECFSLAAACALTDLGTWGQQGVPTKRVSGYRDGVPIELIWWSREHAESWPTGSPSARRGCWRSGRSGSATTRTSSREHGSKTLHSPGAGSHPQVS